MHNKNYLLRPKPCTESALRSRYPWLESRPLMIPSGWFGLVQKACEEIEAIVAPASAAEAVEYFFVTVRESRLRLYIEVDEAFHSEGRANAIKSLITEVQTNCHFLCHICGAEIDPDKHYMNGKGFLPECGQHEDDVNGIEVSEQNSGIGETEVSPARVLKDEETSAAKSSQNETAITNKGVEVTPSLTLYDVKALRTLHRSIEMRSRDREETKMVKATLSKLIKMGGTRGLKSFPNEGEAFLDQLEADFPNFKQVIDMLRGVNALASDNEVPRIPAILLLGPPGVGKTMFAEALAKGMDVAFKVVRMENQQAGAGLVGSAEFWGNSKPGAVFNILTNADVGNPVIVVDEVDKAAKTSQYDPISGLYSLLEPGSASAFHDESFPDVTINASKVTWVLTANYKESIPEPILSRASVFEIPKPDQAQAEQIARRIYGMLLSESTSLKQRFAETLPDKVANLLAGLSPRRMKLAIEMALGKAAIVKRDKLLIEDFEIKEKAVCNAIGFLQNQ